MAYPNAGLPNELGEYDEAAEETAAQVREWAESDNLVNIVGGCCSITPSHIAAIAEGRCAIARRAPSRLARPGTLLAGLEPMTIAA